MYQNIVIGSGFAGAVVARQLAEKKGESVLVIDSRPHVGGNCYDEKDEHGILIHKYGPHIFHTNNTRVYDYLSRFTEWYNYQHEVVGNIYGEEIPVPFNLHSLEKVYGERAPHLKELLIKTFGEGARVPILQLRESDEAELREIADYVYENIFLHYTIKQWGQKPEDIDPSVSGRVPVLVSEDDRYFQDGHQGMPLNGFTPVFNKMLDYPGIEVRLGCSANDILEISMDKIKFEGNPYTGRVIFTGALDELFGCRFGRLPYRSLEFCVEHYDKPFYQSHGVINYTVSEDYTRITEYKYLSGQLNENHTTIMKEYPKKYSGVDGEIPYYAINNEENQALYEKYRGLVDEIPEFYVIGRLAEYKYYNIDAIVDRALTFVDKL